MKSLIDKKDSIFLAGHKGMVGKSIFNQLIIHGYKNIKTLDKKEIDLTSASELEAWFKKTKPSITILAAAKVGGIYANSIYPKDFLLENLKIQNNVIETSWKYNVKRLLFLGSSCIYPKFSKQPIQEESLLTGSLEKTNEYYAIAKIAGIKLCEALRKQANFDAICLMPTNLYGPGDNYHHLNSHVIPALIRKIYEANINKKNNITLWGSGNAYREFLYVEDLAKACIFALEKWNPNSKDSPKDNNGDPLFFLNVGNGQEIKIKHLAEMISKIIGFEGNIKWDITKPDGTPRKLLKIDKILNLGWHSSISLKDGLKMTISSYEKDILNNCLRE